MYNGELINDLMAMVEFHYADCDPHLYLGDVKRHLADKEMDAGDETAWCICDALQAAA